ncbi:serine/threonine-protein kinase [Thermomonospora umbrina]|uniref:non-specific serine/threonine protein kinase n=1 Tax=Thermomonospora umbrina TaxID=111806 RepID=A0A3D9SW57_9ACTN|nr:serine/threonine-protein kinase [Thermomonospora umbrina]REE95881.1 serine/threonine-protein kinase [Thermomonospora umbrina]
MAEWRLPGFVELRELGSGAQGRVVLARDEDGGRFVAIKYLASERLGDERALERFRSEARTLAQVVNPHVARLHRLVEAPEGAAIVMEAVDGVSLRALLDRYLPMSPESALVVLKGSLLGLAAAHAVGVVHRDYKPANVVVQADGLSKLIDFGVAGLAGSQSGSGTPVYMAPEQWEGGPATPATDVYAATCVFFECVTGRRPYTAGNALALMRQHLHDPVPSGAVPEPVRPLVAHGMAKDPTARPPGAEAFVAELEAVAGRAYGSDWESRGWGALGVATAAVAMLFPLAMIGAAGGGALGGTAASAGAGVGVAGQASATTGSGLLATTAAKVVVAVATTAAVAGAGTGAYVAVTDDDPAPVRRVSVVADALDRTVPLSGGRPVLRVQNARYATVTGLGGTTVERQANAALLAPLEREIGRFRAYVENDRSAPGSRPRCADLTSRMDVRLGGPRLVSVRYTIDRRTCSIADEDPPYAVTATVDLRDGRALGAADVFRPASLTAAGLAGLTSRLPPATPDRRECGYNPPLQPAWFQGDEPRVRLTFTATALEFVFSSGLPCPQGLTLTLPHERARDLLRPEMITALTAPRPERS